MALANYKFNSLMPTIIGIQLFVLIFVRGPIEMATVLEDQEPSVVRPLYEFSGKLLNQINKQVDQSGNVIMSPVSIHQALSMVLLGSDDQSETKRELLNTIGYSNMSVNDIERCHQDYANVMTDFARITGETLEQRKEFEKNKKEGSQAEYHLADKQPRSPILDLFTMMVTKNKGEPNPNYAKDIGKYFHASISNINDDKPETKSDLLNKLNDWAKEAGFEGPIMEAKYLDGNFEAILLSAIRVEGFWFDEFYEGNDKKIFYNHGLRDKPVGGKFLSANDVQGSRFMEFTQRELATVSHLHEHMSKDETFNQLSSLNFRAVEIPLQGKLSFAIFEPINNNNESSPEIEPNAKLIKLIQSLFSDFSNGTQNSEKVTNLAKALELLDRHDNYNQLDYFRMPKFKFESDIDLKSILKSVGLKRGFDNQRAEISNITRNKLYIDDIKHKAVIETTKTGIKAAGVTLIKMSLLSAVMKTTRIEVLVENPFMFVLRYQRIPLFVGQLTNL